MNITEPSLHFGSVVAILVINSIASSIGQGVASYGSIQAINIQPRAKDDILKALLINLAFIETPSLLGLVMAVLFTFFTKMPTNFYGVIGELGAVIAFCVPGFFIGILSAWPAYKSSFAIARQPFFAQKTIRFMLLAQSIIQTPIIFGFIIALFIKMQISHIVELNGAMALLAAGIAIGVGSLGPAAGIIYFMKTTCESIGINRNAYTKLVSFSIISAALIETPIIFAFITALLIIPLDFAHIATLPLYSIAMIGAAISIGIGTFGPGIASGAIAAAASKQITETPEQYSLITRTSMLGQVVVDSCAIYTLVVALMLIFFV